MNETSAANTKPEGRAATLVALYERAGYVRAEPALLQPAEPFLDLSGEDIRRRMYLTTDAAGHELCLRPDLTIPVSRDYLASPAAGTPTGFCYLGPVFRYRENGPSEFAQGGIESFGRHDAAAADAEMISLGLEATSHYGIGEPDLRMGDVGLFAALIGALDLAPAWSRRSPAPTRTRRTRSSPTCSRLPASPQSVAVRSARSPTGSSSRRRSAP